MTAIYRCTDCDTVLVGRDEAASHQKATGHSYTGIPDDELPTVEVVYSVCVHVPLGKRRDERVEAALESEGYDVRMVECANTRVLSDCGGVPFDEAKRISIEANAAAKKVMGSE